MVHDKSLYKLLELQHPNTANMKCGKEKSFLNHFCQINVCMCCVGIGTIHSLLCLVGLNLRNTKYSAFSFDFGQFFGLSQPNIPIREWFLKGRVLPYSCMFLTDLVDNELKILSESVVTAAVGGNLQKLDFAYNDLLSRANHIIEIGHGCSQSQHGTSMVNDIDLY